MRREYPPLDLGKIATVTVKLVERTRTIERFRSEGWTLIGTMRTDDGSVRLRFKGGGRDD